MTTTPKRNPLDWDLGNVPPGIAWGGVDEAGRGAWAGPVVAACAVLNPEVVSKWGHVLRGARDSKQLSPEKREALASELKLVLPAWAVAEVDNLGIDRENILEATKEAMRQAVKGLQIRPRILFVDGDRAPGTGLPERLVVEGDALSCAIACASILAKTHRDALLKNFESEHPGYGFAQHKGYGTPEHRKALKAMGTCSIHRLSYGPVKACLRPDEKILVDIRASLDACTSVEQLQAWVSEGLRPAYGHLRPEWVEELRKDYGDRLARLAMEPGPAC
ncbi:MAG: RNase [Holophagaceae bacterium]|nr:RNase [Holophagaceae bacterium]